MTKVGTARMPIAWAWASCAVPTFVIDGRYAVQGAQPPEVFAQVLAKVAAEQAPAAGGDEPACGADGCSV